MNVMGAPYIEIIEQPSRINTRFRYESEKHLGYLYGENYTDNLKTYPKIKIHNLDRNAKLYISLVTANKPYMPHPHGLHVKEPCTNKNMTIINGVCHVLITPDNPEFELKNMGIKCVTRKEVSKALDERLRRGIDPFGTGFEHRRNIKNIDLTAVRLAFSCELQITDNNQFSPWLNPIVSKTIKDEKTRTRLNICKLGSNHAPVSGGKEISMFTDKLNIHYPPKIRFFELDSNGKEKWKAYGEYNLSDIHHLWGLSVRTPAYHTLDIEEPIDAFIQLEGTNKTEEIEFSEALRFQFIPDDISLKRKPPKIFALANNFVSNYSMYKTPVNSVQSEIDRNNHPGTSTRSRNEMDWRPNPSEHYLQVLNNLQNHPTPSQYTGTRPKLRSRNTQPKNENSSVTSAGNNATNIPMSSEKKSSINFSERQTQNSSNVTTYGLDLLSSPLVDELNENVMDPSEIRLLDIQDDYNNSLIASNINPIRNEEGNSDFPRSEIAEGSYMENNQEINPPFYCLEQLTPVMQENVFPTNQIYNLDSPPNQDQSMENEMQHINFEIHHDDRLELIQNVPSNNLPDLDSENIYKFFSNFDAKNCSEN